MQLMGEFDAVAFYNECGDVYQTVIAILSNLPAYKLVLVVLICSMIAFYATSFDSITLVARIIASFIKDARNYINK